MTLQWLSMAHYKVLMGLCAPLSLATPMANTLRQAQMTRHLGYGNDSRYLHHSSGAKGSCIPLFSLGVRTISLRIWGIQAFLAPVIGKSLRVHRHDVPFIASSPVRKHMISGMMDNPMCMRCEYAQDDESVHGAH